MIRRLYDWTMRLADHPRAMWALAVVAFVESSVFPIPPDVIMIPMILARPHRAWAIAGVALVASVIGGMLGYAIGALAYEQIGQPILAAMGKGEAMETFNTRFNDLGFWAVLTAGMTPFPLQGDHHHVRLDRDAVADLRRNLDLGAGAAVFHRCGIAVEIRRTYS